MSTSSVFPLEIYEHILELSAGDVRFPFMLGNTFSYVCTAWRPKSRALVYRLILIEGVEFQGIATMRKLRRKLVEYPHFAPLVERVEIYVHSSPSQYESIVEAFPSMLGRYLPRLRRITVDSQCYHLPIHRYFSIRRVQLHSVTVLELSHATFDQKFTLNWYISPFPSLRVLDLYGVVWAETPTIEKLPALIELELGLKGNSGGFIWSKVNRDAYECLLNTAGCTVRLLLVDFPLIYIFTSLHDDKWESIHLDALEVLNMKVHAEHWLHHAGNDLKDIPYSQAISDMVSFLFRLNAEKLHILNISFQVSTFSFAISEEDFLDCLRAVQGRLEELVLKNHFPSLQAINIDVGADGTTAPIWQDRLGSCFPLLARRQLLHVKESIPKEPKLWYKLHTSKGLSLDLRQDKKGKSKMVLN